MSFIFYLYYNICTKIVKPFEIIQRNAPATIILKVFHRFLLRITQRNVYNNSRLGLTVKIKDTTSLLVLTKRFYKHSPNSTLRNIPRHGHNIILVRFIDSSFVSRFSFPFQKDFLMEVFFLFMCNIFFMLIVI